MQHYKCISILRPSVPSRKEEDQTRMSENEQGETQRRNPCCKRRRGVAALKTTTTFFRGAGFLGTVSDIRRGDANVMSDTSRDTTLLHSTNRRLYMSRNSSKSIAVRKNKKAMRRSNKLNTKWCVVALLLRKIKRQFLMLELTLLREGE